MKMDAATPFTSWSDRASRELLEVIVVVCRKVIQLVECYEVGREPDKLDCLVYHVDRLYRILLALNTSTNGLLEAVGTSLTLLEEMNRSLSTENVCGYTPAVLYEHCRGRPRLDIKQEQLEYLLHSRFNCPKIAEILGVSLSTVRRRMNLY